MSMTQAAKEYHDRMFPGYHSNLLETDPEFIERFDNFAFDAMPPQICASGTTRRSLSRLFHSAFPTSAIRAA